MLTENVSYIFAWFPSRTTELYKDWRVSLSFTLLSQITM